MNTIDNQLDTARTLHDSALAEARNQMPEAANEMLEKSHSLISSIGALTLDHSDLPELHHAYGMYGVVAGRTGSVIGTYTDMDKLDTATIFNRFDAAHDSFGKVKELTGKEDQVRLHLLLHESLAHIAFNGVVEVARRNLNDLTPQALRRSEDSEHYAFASGNNNVREITKRFVGRSIVQASVALHPISPQLAKKLALKNIQ